MTGKEEGGSEREGGREGGGREEGEGAESERGGREGVMRIYERECREGEVRGGR